MGLKMLKKRPDLRLNYFILLLLLTSNLCAQDGDHGLYIRLDDIRAISSGAAASSQTPPQSPVAKKDRTDTSVAINSAEDVIADEYFLPGARSLSEMR